MTFGTAAITSVTPVKDLMTALQAPMTAAGYTLVDSFASPAAANWSNAAFGNGIFVSVASGASTVMTSTDAITWTARSLPVTQTLGQATFGAGLFVVAVAVSGANLILTSPDGVTWTQRPVTSSANTWNVACYGGGQFVILASNTASSLTSPDGINWTMRPTSTAAVWAGVTYGVATSGTATYFAVNQSSTNITMTSPDAVNWTQRVMPVSSAFAAPAFGNGLFVVPVTNTANVYTSPDATNWSLRTNVMPSSASWAKTFYGGGLFIATATSGTAAASSPDGTTWTQRLVPAGNYSQGAYGNGVYAVPGFAQTTAMSSPDGFNWTARNHPGASTFPTADVYKSPAAGNQNATDWYLILRRSTDTATALQYQVAETYDTTLHRAGNLGGLGVSSTPLATTFTNPVGALAPDSATAFATSAALTLTSGTAFTYWYSITGDRAVVAVRTTAESAFYAGLHEDLLPAGTALFPLVCAAFPTSSSATRNIGGGGVNASGGFTREPGQTLVGTTNFEAAIHNGFQFGPFAGTAQLQNSGFSWVTSSQAIYGNSNSLSRIPIGSLRAASGTADAVRGLLYGCVMSLVVSVAGDTITSGGKTYLRVCGTGVGSIAYFVDAGL